MQAASNQAGDNNASNGCDFSLSFVEGLYDELRIRDDRIAALEAEVADLLRKLGER